MSLISEFKQFAAKGNVVDLAVGVVIGASFGKIVTSFVNDMLMPPLGVILGGVNFKDLKITLKAAEKAGNKIVAEAVTLNYGNFIQALVDFLIIAFAIFMLVKAINHLKFVKLIDPKPAEAPPLLTPQEKLLTEIRDALLNNKKP